jgi:hypothetical protein
MEWRPRLARGVQHEVVRVQDLVLEVPVGVAVVVVRSLLENERYGRNVLVLSAQAAAIDPELLQRFRRGQIRLAHLVLIEGLRASRAAVAEIIQADAVQAEVGTAPVMTAGDLRVGDVGHVAEAGHAGCENQQAIDRPRGRRQVGN